MEIRQLELKDFRNYPELTIEFDPGTNIICGDNAQGKTNILEAVYLCATSRSHRGAKDKEMIRFGQEEAHLRMDFMRKENERRLDVHLKKSRAKGIAVDRIPLRRVSELFGLINVIMFSPEDLSMVNEGPAERRRFLDLELCQLDPLYAGNLAAYNKVLSERNRILKEMEERKDYKDLLPLYDEKLIFYGKEIIRSRARFCEKLVPLVEEIHGCISGGREVLKISYEPNVREEMFEEALIKNATKERFQHVTLTGPHRDDIAFLGNNIDLRIYGSQGQKRSAALSLKMSEIELVKEAASEMPVLLLDDVLSELDKNRQENLLARIDRLQTILSCTGVDEFVRSRFEINKVFMVKDNQVGGYQ